MAGGSTLREYQSSILARLEEAKNSDTLSAIGFLGVMVAGKPVLVNMQEISETLPMMEIFPVPLVKPWFMGMANIRGVLYAINDLGQLINGAKTLISSESRMLLINDGITPHVAILVEKLIGLRKLETMHAIESKKEPDFCMKSERYEDEKNLLWHVLDCQKLVQSAEFTQSY